jgi:hypothetical protein
MLYFWHLIKYVGLFFKTKIYFDVLFLNPENCKYKREKRGLLHITNGTEAVITALEDGIRTVKKGREGIYI